MTNYAVYRISETIRVVLFITASIMAFGGYPVTALMIVLLAILNDLPVITIAYDNVKYSDVPEKWDMNRVLTISTFLGIIGVFSSFGIFLIGKFAFHLSTDILRSFIYLKLSVAGHTVLLAARTKSYFWTVRPAKILLFAVIATQLTATLLTVYGILLPAMGWGLAGFVWAYALALFLVTDFLKVQFYKLLDRRSPRIPKS
jgi:H+-transporting ATPase